MPRTLGDAIAQELKDKALLDTLDDLWSEVRIDYSRVKRRDISLNLDQIRLDAGTQLRKLGLNRDHVEDLVDQLKLGTMLDPVEVVWDGSCYYLTDGFHRVDAYRRVGNKAIRCICFEGSLRSAILKASGSNSRHLGLKRTRADIRHATMQLLQDSEWASRFSNYKLAEIIGVSEGTIRRYKGEAAQQLQERILTVVPSGRKVGSEDHARPAAPSQPSNIVVTRANRLMDVSNLRRPSSSAIADMLPYPKEAYQLNIGGSPLPGRGELWTSGIHTVYCGDSDDYLFQDAVPDRIGLAFACLHIGSDNADHLKWLGEKAEIVCLLNQDAILVYPQETTAIPGLPYRLAAGCNIHNRWGLLVVSSKQDLPDIDDINRSSATALLSGLLALYLRKGGSVAVIDPPFDDGFSPLCVVDDIASALKVKYELFVSDRSADRIDRKYIRPWQIGQKKAATA